MPPPDRAAPDVAAERSAASLPPGPDRRDAPPRRWPATTITVIVGLFVVVVLSAWVWSHVVRREAIDDVAWIILGATLLRIGTIAVAWIGQRDPSWLGPTVVSVALFGCASAQLVYPVAELVVKVLVLVGLADDGPSGIRNMSLTGWFNFAAAAAVFGVPGALFAIEGAEHRRRHRLRRRCVAAGSLAGVAALLAIGVAIG